ncbi:MAG: cupin domain-containing protein [Verrucomicrobiota bacterium]
MSHHFIMSDQEGSSAIAKQEAPEFSALEYQGWSGQALEASGVFCFILKVKAGGDEFPMHADAAAWLGYVVSGSGELFSGNAAGDKLEAVAFAAGDFITFEPNTQHAWKNGPDESKILVVKVA